METAIATLAGGFVLGLAGSVHCACMCGGIASGALFILRPETARERLYSLLLLQAGRIATYTLAGAAVAGISSLAIDPTATTATYRVLQWFGAVVLMWTGLATAGLMPRLASPGAGTWSMVAYFEPVLAPLRRHPRLGPLAMGISWGLTPCPMVYAALFTAALAGSAVNGALWMAAFGAGTLPGVIGAALGISALSRTPLRFAGRRGAEMGAGLLIAGLGFATLYFGWPMAGVFCITR